MQNRKRRPAFIAVLYRVRNLVGLFFDKLKLSSPPLHATTKAKNFLASVQLAFIRDWPHDIESSP